MEVRRLSIGGAGPAPQRRLSFVELNEDLEGKARECGVTVAQYEEMLDVYSLFDAQGGGAIDPKEIRTQMRSLGFEVDNTTIYQLISDLDSDGSQKIEFEEFAGLLTEELGLYNAEGNSQSNIRAVFDFMDELDPAKRDAQIELSNLRRIADVLGDKISDIELEAMIKGADKDGKGYVTGEDFYELMVGVAHKLDAVEPLSGVAATEDTQDRSSSGLTSAAVEDGSETGVDMAAEMDGLAKGVGQIMKRMGTWKESAQQAEAAKGKELTS